MGSLDTPTKLSGVPPIRFGTFLTVTSSTRLSMIRSGPKENGWFASNLDRYFMNRAEAMTNEALPQTDEVYRLARVERPRRRPSPSGKRTPPMREYSSSVLSPKSPRLSVTRYLLRQSDSGR
jgi:hypothetical protein